MDTLIFTIRINEMDEMKGCKQLTKGVALSRTSYGNETGHNFYLKVKQACGRDPFTTMILTSESVS